MFVALHGRNVDFATVSGIRVFLTRRMEENSTQVQMEISPKQSIEATDSSNDSGKENNLPCKNSHDKEILNGQEPNQTVNFQSKILNHNKVLENRSADVRKNADKMEIEENIKQDGSSPSHLKPQSTNDSETSDVEMLDDSHDKSCDIAAATTDTNAATTDTIVATKDTIVATKDTIVATKDTIVATKDTIVATKDTNAPIKDANVATTDTNSTSKDAISVKTDTNASIADTNASATDTNAAANVSLKNSGDAKCATPCEINNDKLTNESQCMDISEKNCEITSVNSNGTDFDDKSNTCDTKEEGKEKTENSVEKILDEDGDEFIITMNEDADESDGEEEDENHEDEENTNGNKKSSDVTPIITLPPLPPLPRTTVNNTVQIPKKPSQSLISQSLKGGQNSSQNAALLLSMNNFSNSSLQTFQQKSMVQNKSSYLPPVLTPQSSTEMMSLIKWEISNRISNQRPKYQQNQPDNELGPLSKFLFELGNDLVRETVYNDLVRIQTYRKSTGKLSEKETEDLCKLKDVQSELKYLVGPIKHNFKLKCKCGFRTESKNILVNHQEYPHVDENDFSCAVCNDYETKQPAAFVFHMEAMHNMRGRIENKQAFWTCNLCPYENNSKSKLTQHRFRCLKNFNLKTNLSQNSVIGMEVNFCLENNFYKRKDPPKTLHTANNTRQQSIAPKPKVQSSSNTLVTAINKPAPVIKAAGNDVTKKINTLISQNHLVLSQNKGPANESGGFEVCEICGGYVKDRKALRIHFYYAHRKEIPDRAQAPLYCATCFARFWTAQGLQKHLEVHKVTNAAKCLICGHKVPNVLMHMRIVHTKELGNFLATCKCIYCGLVCSSKRGVESHMVGVHGIMIKTESIVTNSSMGMTQKPQKQPAPRGCMCVLCNLQFSRNVDLTRHCMKVHHTCMKCGMVVADKVSLDKHTCLKSIKGLRDCELCSEQGFHPAYHVKHIRDKHIRKCTIPLIKLPNWVSKSVKDKKLISKVESICKGKKTDNCMEVDDTKEQRSSKKRPHADNDSVLNDTVIDITSDSPSKIPCLDTSV
ncbi:hypothetical protein LOTGIDRAFT_234890 [Lottia gigantea]|uniref:C2H2-type domain-containing protein n=1 Tax=Lottia gigantea TaxID=225164 RepID=V3ZZ55_LOTGI|nr:hypothetical protein LOTGIDRAFT_234890 [Lottia gigantea]ESO87910.1 hypothetical protein LOTGIDRAFT_234890 [Lottia gigantea]